MGRRTKPSALKALQGNPGHRPENRAEPLPDPANVRQMPAWLDAEARRAWRELFPKLLKVKILSEIDVVAFALLCQTYSDFIRATRELRKKNNRILKTTGGYQQQGPWVALASASAKQLRGLLADFGLTPSSRSQLKIELPNEEGKDAFEKWLQNAEHKAPASSDAVCT